MIKAPTTSRTMRKEWLALVAAFLMLGSFIGWERYTDYEALGARARERLSTQARVVHDTTGRQLLGANLALESIRRDLYKWRIRKEGMQEANEQLRVFADAMPGVRVMLILDAEGNAIASNRQEIIGRNFRERDYFQMVVKDPNPDTLYVTPPFKTVLNTWVINVVRMVPGPKGEFNGLVSASLDPEEFNIILESVRFSPDMWSGLAHGDGKLFLMAPPRPELSGVDLNQPGSMFSRHLATGKTESIQEGVVSATNERRIMAHRTTYFPALRMNKPLVITVSRDIDALYAPWRSDTTAEFVLFGILVTVSGISLYLLQRRRHMNELERRDANLALAAERDRSRIYVDTVQTMVLALNSDGSVHMINPYGARLLGGSVEEIVGKNWFATFLPQPEGLDIVFPRFQEMIEGKLHVMEFYENQVVHQSGRLIDIAWHNALLRTPDGYITGTLSAGEDITQRKANDATLRQAKEAAEAANKAKSLFLANMSHEIRTPMNAVLGLLQLLQHTELTERQVDYTQKAHAAGTSLLGILNDILDFSKVEAGKMQIEHAEFHLDDVLRNLSVMLSSAVGKKKVEVLFDMDADLPRGLFGDSLRLQQVLLNLCGNAIKFTEHGEVVLALRTLELTPKRARIEFSVRDTGIGIAADMLERIFEGFTQAESSTTRRFGGTGLGLSICQRLVHLMGGTLTAQSTLGKGSCFCFTLEFQRAADGTQAAPRAPVSLAKLANFSKDATKPLQVLIVDDNAVARDVLSHITSQLGWRTELASSGSEALARLQSGSAPFDAIFVDWNMPDLDGWETSLKIRELFSRTENQKAPAIIMITAHGPEIMAEHDTDEGLPFDAFLVKPITPSMMFDAVANATAGTALTIDRRTAQRQSTHRLEGMHLLLVEDNPMNQQVARELLTLQGASIVVANNGRQGVERVAQALAAHALFDAVLMDIQMPEMDGYEATRVLREELRLKDLPIIAMTANALPADRATCLAAGMTDHVGKPFDLSELIDTLRRHTGRDTHVVSKIAVAVKPMDNEHMDAEPVGFELDLALRRLENNKKLYALLARSFRTEQGVDVSLTRQALAQGDHNTAIRLMHTLKGVAATLGASALSALAKETEAALRNSATPPAELDALLDRLDTDLQQCCIYLEQLAERFSSS